LLNLTERPPFCIHGPGGMGKSSLVSRFILEHAEAAESQRIPFIYLDFDRPGLVAEEPVTLLLEAVRQLRTQYPQNAEQADECLRRWSDQLWGREPIAKPKRSETTVPAVFGHVANRGRFLDEFTELVSSFRDGSKPLLLVLDTFEEVQVRSRAFVEAVWEFLDDLQRKVPRLRIVVSGRAPVTDLTTASLPLTELDPEAARAVLERGLAEALGAPDPATAAAVVAQVGGNPLSLKLAVEVIRKEGAGGGAGIRDLKTRNLFFVRVRDAVLQGRLYQRILDHIRDDEVRKLAHPGLILRRITWELIRDVLAGPCGVTVRDDDHARKLYARLEQEVSLVRPGSDEAIYHRSDVRRAMLEDLRRSMPEAVRDIEQKAITFYTPRTDPISRAEEIYHRLSLGEDPAEVDRRWIEGLGPLLSGSVEELPARAQAYLANRLQLTIDPTL